MAVNGAHLRYEILARANSKPLNRGSFQGLLRYMDEGHRHYHLGIEKLVNRDFSQSL